MKFAQFSYNKSFWNDIFFYTWVVVKLFLQNQYFYGNLFEDYRSLDRFILHVVYALFTPINHAAACKYIICRSMTTSETNSGYNKQLNRKRKKGYRHVPHSEKPTQIVEKRNARERKRVHAVNQAFIRLRRALPMPNKVWNKVSEKYSA